MLKERCKWHEHEGEIIVSKNGFDVIDCEICGFKHITPVPTEDELNNTYQHDYYTQEKPLYLERYLEDLEWWNMVYAERYQILEQNLGIDQRTLLDIGSGPGFFLLNGKERGWKVKGIEPSERAAEHSQQLGVDVVNSFFSAMTAPGLGKFDAINMSEVLEHIPNPASLLSLVYKQLNEDGVVCIAVPNDFNPFQKVLHTYLGFKSWWVAPPHHINYFDFDSIQKLLERCGFDVIYKEATFPIDMFLLMGDNYIEDDKQGRICHAKRMMMELNLSKSGMSELKRELYRGLAKSGLGREVVIFARKSKELR